MYMKWNTYSLFSLQLLTHSKNKKEAAHTHTQHTHMLTPSAAHIIHTTVTNTHHTHSTVTITHIIHAHIHTTQWHTQTSTHTNTQNTVTHTNMHTPIPLPTHNPHHSPPRPQPLAHSVFQHCKTWTNLWHRPFTEAHLLGNIQGLLFGDAGDDVYWLLDDGIGVFCCHFLDVHTALWTANQHWTLEWCQQKYEKNEHCARVNEWISKHLGLVHR